MAMLHQRHLKMVDQFQDLVVQEGGKTISKLHTGPLARGDVPRVGAWGGRSHRCWNIHTHNELGISGNSNSSSQTTV